MADHMETELVEQALHMALTRQQPPPGLLHHSDQGSQYASTFYQNWLAEHDILVSMSRQGNCYDNAMAESFFATLKLEALQGSVFATRSQARMAIFDYIEVFYNRQRLHSGIVYAAPVSTAA